MARHGREARNQWDWVERGIWTDRMLKTLVTGVKGGKWFSLIDKVYGKANLIAAYKKVARNKGAAGVDHVTVKGFAKNLEREIAKLHESLRMETYRPQAIKRVTIPKPGTQEGRPLGMPTVRDRVVQGALRHAIEPIFEKDFAEHSYGFRPHRGCKDALRQVDRYLKEGYGWVVDADFKSYFDTIPHDRLMKLVGGKISDLRVLRLIEAFLTQQVMDGMSTWRAEKGCPQGAVLSPLLANIYLDPLDHQMAQAGLVMLRYADDAVILCKSEREAHHALEKLKAWTESAQLQLHPDKTHIVDMCEPGGFDFLGYHFERSRYDPNKLNRWPGKKSIKNLRNRLKPLTKRTNGKSLGAIIALINPILRGWYAYYKHGKSNSLQDVDGWVRGRLRSILRKRAKKKGRSRGDDHHRWPNAYFHSLGLFSTYRARRLVIQSSRR